MICPKDSIFCHLLIEPIVKMKDTRNDMNIRIWRFSWLHNNDVAKEIRRLRHHVGITQKQLCEGICHQSMLSKIEKGETYPSAKILYLLSKRLGVEMEHFFRFSKIPNVEYVHHFYQKLRKAVREKDYLEVKRIVNREENNPGFKDSAEIQQILLWHKGMVEYYIHQNDQNAILLLEQALNHQAELDFKGLTEREVEILNTLAVIHAEVENFREALVYYQRAEQILSKKITIKDPTVLIRVLYNTAKVYTRLKDYILSINLCERAIEVCKDYSLMYLYGELHYHIAYNYEFLKREPGRIIEMYKNAINIFVMQGDMKYIDFIERRINAIQKLSRF
jgi:transcriptional regulator with XRE-family HTH domain